jgi:hypothetical protein
MLRFAKSRMPRKHRDIRSGLAAKGFTVDEQRRHIVLVYEDLQGRTTTARTLISHGAGGNEIHDALLGRMARQVGFARKDFLRLIDCPMSREEFDSVIAKRDDQDDIAATD